MYLGDNMLQQGVADVRRPLRSGPRPPTPDARRATAPPPAAQILLAHVDDPHRFGVAAFDVHGDVVRLVEKPADPPSDLALVGVYLFTPPSTRRCAAIEPSDRGELEITDAIQWLIDHGHRVRHEVLQGWWLDTGKKDPLLECNRLVLETLEPRIDGQVDEDSRVDGRVVIEDGAELINSRRARARDHRRRAPGSSTPTSARSRRSPPTARSIDTEIEHSVVLDHSRIHRRAPHLRLPARPRRRGRAIRHRGRARLA